MKKNILDIIPNKAFGIEWITSEEKVILVVKNKGLINYILQKTLKKPKKSYIHLDNIGSVVWKKIDGKNTIYDIGAEIKNVFGESVTPLYERLTEYIMLLKKCNFVVLKKTSI